MKKIIAAFAVLLLGACATNVSLTDVKTGISAGGGVLEIAFLSDGNLNIRLDGADYQGNWTPLACEKEPCESAKPRSPETNYHISHGRHTMLGKAVLSASNGSTLDCKWKMHRQSVEGTCAASDGRKFTLNNVNE